MDKSQKVDRLLSRMRSEWEDSTILMKSIETLLGMIKEDSNLKDTIADRRGIELAVKLMNEPSNTPDVLGRLCLFLRTLSSHNPRNKLQIAKVGGYEAIVSAMKRHSADLSVQEKGCEALWIISVPAENKPLISAAGGIEAIVAAMGAFVESPEVQYFGCAALQNIADNDENQVTVAERHGIEAIVRALSRHKGSDKVQLYGCAALQNLSANSENKKRIAALGGLEAVIGTMTAYKGSPKIQAYACATLRNLTSKGQNRAKVCALEGIEAVLGAMSSNIKEQEIQYHGISVLSALAQHDFEAQLRMDTFKAPQIVIKAMLAHKDNPDLCFVAMRLLRIIVVYTYSKIDIPFKESISAITAAMRSFPETLPIQEAGTQALATILAFQELYDDYCTPQVLERAEAAHLRFPESQLIAQHLVTLKRGEDPRAHAAIIRRVCTSTAIPQCHECPRAAGDYCPRCSIPQKAYHCLTCDGRFSPKLYCVSCGLRYHGDHKTRKIFLPTRCACAEDGCCCSPRMYGLERRGSTAVGGAAAGAAAATTSGGGGSAGGGQQGGSSQGAVPPSGGCGCGGSGGSSGGLFEPRTDFPLEVSKKKLTFGLGSRQALVDKEYTEDIVLKNVSGSKSGYNFCIGTLESDKYKLVSEPSSRKLQYGEKVTVTFRFTFLCTSRFDAEIPIVAWHKHPNKSRRFVISCNLRSVATFKLDPDEIMCSDKPLGEGSYGVVYKGRYHAQDVAVKVLKNQDSPKVQSKFLKEEAILEMLRHPCIVLFVGASFIQGRLSLVSEYCPYGGLDAVLKDKDACKKLTYRHKLKCLYDIACGMGYMHSSGLMHRDLKAGNALLVSYNLDYVMCKLTDFGFTRDVNIMKPLNMTKCGSPIYEAPEIIAGKAYDFPADVYSYAMTMVHVITEYKPYKFEKFASTFRK